MIQNQQTPDKILTNQEYIQYSSSTQDSITIDQFGNKILCSIESMSDIESQHSLLISKSSTDDDSIHFSDSLRTSNHYLTLLKRHRRKSKRIAEEERMLMKDRQSEIIYRLKTQPIRYTKQYLEVIVPELEKRSYELESYLTSGGQSDIFKGFHTNSEGESLERVFKIIKSDFSEISDQMSEYNLLKTISYPLNIIQFYDVIQIESDSILIFIIESCECSLEDEMKSMISNHIYFTKIQLAQIFFDLLDGLIELRAHNIIHQDIKPQNILKTKTGKYVYSDFGISGKLKDNQVEVKGYTLYFCSPEQMTSISLSDYKSDIYSLGKTFQRIIQFYRSCKQFENYYDSPFLQEVLSVIEKKMINFDQSERVDCLDLIQAIYDIVLRNDKKEISSVYLEQVNKINSLNKYDNSKDIPFMLKAKRIYRTLHLQINLHLSGVILLKDDIMSQKFYEQIQSLKQSNLRINHIADSIQQLAICLFDLGEIEQSLTLQQESLKLFKKIYSGNHEILASSYNNIGELFAALGQTQIALENQIKSLEINQALYKSNHPCTSVSLNNVGKRYTELGEYQKALIYQQQALKMRQHLYKGKHQQTANTLNNIGALYSKLGDTQTALKFQKEALEMYQELIEGNHPDLAACLNNVGKKYEELGEGEMAIHYLSESLSMYRQLFNPNHPVLATSLNNLGSVYAKVGQPQKALHLQLESYEIKKQIYPENHPKLSSLLHNIGQRYAELDFPDKGLKYQLRSLEMRRIFYQKANNLNIAQSLDSVGERCAEMKNYKQALEYQKESLDMRKALIKGNHICIASSLENVGERYAQLGENQVALSYQLQSLKQYKKIFHEDNAHIATSLNNIGKRYDEIGDQENALKYQLLSLEMRKRIFKQNHPSIAQSLNNIGERYSKMGNIEKALEYQLESLTIYETQLKNNHPFIRTLLKNISNKYTQLGQEEKALEYQQRFLELKNILQFPLLSNKSLSSNTEESYTNSSPLSKSLDLIKTI